MSHDPSVASYRQYLENHSYEEYAEALTENARNDEGEGRLDLSLWHDDPPPGVADAISAVLPAALGEYSPAQNKALADSVAERLGIAEQEVAITAGADDALNILATYCATKGTKVLIPVPCFGRNKYHPIARQSDIFELPFDTFPYEFDVGTILNAIHSQNISCVILASPNNPTGHQLSTEAIRQLLDGADCDVILDESLLLDLSGSNAKLINVYPNLFVCGSFSKLYALPGARIGYLAANTVHQAVVRKLISPFAVSSLGLVAARHAIGQEDWARQRAADVRQGIAVLRDAHVPNVGISNTSASVALLEYDGPANLHEALLDRGIMAVPGKEFPGLSKQNVVRVIIRGMREMQLLTKALASLS